MKITMSTDNGTFDFNHVINSALLTINVLNMPWLQGARITAFRLILNCIEEVLAEEHLIEFFWKEEKTNEL
jgi:methylthioribose-1-phosphate isomerase